MIFLWIILFFLVIYFPSFVVHFKDYKHYKKLYLELDNNFSLVRNGNQIYRRHDLDGSFTWFLVDDSICIKKGVYLHNYAPIYLDPYAYFWWRKILKKLKSKPIVGDYSIYDRN